MKIPALSRRSDADRAQLKAATRRLVMMAGGPESAQHVTRVKSAALSRFGSLSDEQFMPIDVVADLEADVGSGVVTQTLAEQVGCNLVHCQSGAAGHGAPLAVENIADLISREAVVAQEIVSAMADGKVTPCEGHRISKAVEDAIAGLRNIQNAASAAAESSEIGGGGKNV